MKTRSILILSVLIAGFILTGCESMTMPTDAPAVGVANPASVYCVESGYASEIRTDENGGQYGVCIFDDDSECEEWAYYRGECGPVVRPAELPDFVQPVRDAVIAYINQNYSEVTLPDSGSWNTGISSSAAYARSRTYRLTSGNWMMTITVPNVPPESSTPLTFSIFVSNVHPEQTFFWRGEVDEAGILKQTSP
jgi:hypothetical protein